MFYSIRRIAWMMVCTYLGKVLYLITNPYSKKANKGDSKEEQENRLNTERSTSFSNFNGTIVECALVWVLLYLIDNGPHKMICSRLQQKDLL